MLNGGDVIEFKKVNIKILKKLYPKWLSTVSSTSFIFIHSIDEVWNIKCCFIISLKYWARNNKEMRTLKLETNTIFIIWVKNDTDIKTLQHETSTTFATKSKTIRVGVIQCQPNHFVCFINKFVKFEILSKF